MTSLFSLPYPSYHIWINYTWITDIWKFSHQVKITVEVENQWLPRIARQHDVALMDLAISLSFNEFQLRSINTYRLFLQVTTLSDIVSANGEFIIPCIVEGYRDESRGTDLLWPNIPRPPISFWRHWHQFLQHFVTGRRLTQPLGQWFDEPMNSWHWFLDPENTLWHTNPSDGTWTEYATVPPINRPRTRQTTKVYTVFATSTAPILPLLPATITTQSDGTVSASPSSYPLHKATPPCPSDLWRHSTTPPALEDTPPFFQHLISTPFTADQCQEIAMEIQEKTLSVCSDGACDSQLNITSFAVVFASSLLQQTITTAVGPVDGYPSLVTSYRAELSGIIACLYIIHRICHYYQIESGSCTLYCDNKGALRNTFRPIRPGITPYLRTDHDLVEIAQSLLTILSMAITPTWVKGHYKGKKREYQHTLNDEADERAGEYQQFQHPHVTICCPIAPPNFKVRLLHDDSVLTAKVQPSISSAMHTAPIEEHIMRKAGWDRQVFNLVHWDTHEKSFKRLPRYSRHSTSKIQDTTRPC
jgi:ribonuclease HI